MQICQSPVSISEWVSHIRSSVQEMLAHLKSCSLCFSICCGGHWLEADRALLQSRLLPLRQLSNHANKFQQPFLVRARSLADVWKAFVTMMHGGLLLRECLACNQNCLLQKKQESESADVLPSVKCPRWQERLALWQSNTKLWQSNTDLFTVIQSQSIPTFACSQKSQIIRFQWLEEKRFFYMSQRILIKHTVALK